MKGLEAQSVTTTSELVRTERELLSMLDLKISLQALSAHVKVEETKLTTQSVRCDIYLSLHSRKATACKDQTKQNGQFTW